MTPPPVTAQFYRYLPNTLSPTIPGARELLTLEGQLESYRHRIIAFGGEESCQLTYRAAPGAVAAWLALAGGVLTVHDQHAARVFDGTVETVAIDDGRRAQSLTAQGMATAVRVMYTRRGVQTATARAVNTTATARYFVRELLYSGGEMTTTQAETTRDQLLAALAFPREDVPRSLATRPPVGEATVTVTARGWTAALAWAHYDLPPRLKTGTTNANALVINIVNDTIASVAPTTYGNEIVGLPAGSSSVTYTGPSVDRGVGPALGLVFPTTRGYEPALTVLERVIDHGDTGGDRVAWGFNLARSTPDISSAQSFFWARVWAGATPDVATYYLRTPSTILDTALMPVPWTQVRPDTMAYDLDTPALPPRTGAGADTGVRRYVATVEYGWQRGSGETLAIAPEETHDPATILARVR